MRMLDMRVSFFYTFHRKANQGRRSTMNHLPRVGMRMIKTAMAVCICFMIYFLRGEEGVPVFSTIAAII